MKLILIVEDLKSKDAVNLTDKIHTEVESHKEPHIAVCMILDQ